MHNLPERLTRAVADRYRIERELGQGGMATVYLADDLKHDRKVAIKVLRPELAAVVGGERFLAEIKTTAALQHPNILPLFDSGEADSFLFYVMPYVEGESLRDKLDREKQLRVEDALSLTRKVADALDYAHEKGVVHRDIKPANILLSERGEPLVADFGIALAVSQAGGGRITETGLSLGTPHYMSPEQATGDRDVDPRSDLYALGCVLYELLAGQPPFAAPTAQAVLARILTETPRRVTELRRTVPPHIASVLERALEKLPADRFESAREFLAALDDPGFTYEADLVTAAMLPTRRVHRPAAGADRPAMGLVAGVAVATLLVGTAAGLALGGGGNGASPPQAPVRVALTDFPSEAPSGSGERLAITRDGSKIAAVTNEDGEYLLYWRRTNELERTLVRAAGAVGRPTFSPDGQWLAFTDGDMIRRVELAGGPIFPVVEGGAPHWGTDDLMVFARDRSLYSVAPSGGEPTLLWDSSADLVPGGVQRPRLLPDGSGVVFQAGDPDPSTGDRKLYVFEMESGEVVDLGLQGANPQYLASGHLVFGYQSQSLGAVPFDLRSLRPTGQPTTVLLGVTVYGGGATQFAASDNGTAFYEVGGSAVGSQETVSVFDFDGGEEPAAIETGSYADVRWSPDGRTIAYVGFPTVGGPPAIYSYSVDLRQAARQVTFEGASFSPVFSPDGTQLAFASNREGAGGIDIYVKNLTDDRPARLLSTVPGNQLPGDWPFDDMIVFWERGENSGSESFWTIDPTSDDPEPTLYLESTFPVGTVSVSPEAGYAAYASEESGEGEVYLRGFPEIGQPERISSGGGRAPQWSRDGRTVWYWAPGPVGTLIQVRIDPGPPFSVLSRDTVGVFAGLGLTEASVHPDGGRIIATREVAGGDGDGDAPPAQAMLVVNWFTELERLTRGNR